MIWSSGSIRTQPLDTFPPPARMIDWAPKGPWNAVMAMRKGVRVAVKSDSNDYMRRLNQEAGKTIRYGGATEDEALRMITLNAAWVVGVDDRISECRGERRHDITKSNVSSAVRAREPLAIR